ncbi:MAG: hypothetical protein Q7S23_02390 [bacterium]|nr:hypothetical protein [bacterium]
MLKYIVASAGVLIIGGCTPAVTPTPSPTATPQPSPAEFTEAQARVIAEATCIKGGETLAPGSYNENSKTWWFGANLNATREGCNPACVVSAETKTAELNWRCTGAKPPAGESATCTIESRNADVCTQQYDPVCGTVQIQCIRAPCYPIEQTFSNACEACRNSLVSSYVRGACEN